MNDIILYSDKTLPKDGNTTMANLTDDLKAIRSQIGLTPTDVFEKSRIPLSVVKEIENGTVFDKPEKQTTYIRSFIRAYAKVIGISDDDAIVALDAHYNGSYDGFLVEKYKGQLKQAPVKPKSSTELNIDRLVTTTLGAEEYSRPDPSRPYNQKTPPPPEITSINWADMGKKFAGFNSGSSFIIIIAVILVLTGISLYFVGAFDGMFSSEPSVEVVLSEETPDENPQDAPAVTQLTTENDTISVPVSVNASSFPDTMFILVYAYNDKLEPIRVRSDVNNILSPYWIEQGEAMRFEFIDEINMRGQFSRMVLLFNGHLIDNFQRFQRPDGFVRITRNYLESEPRYRTVSPSELPGGIPEPTVIRNRPVF